jgi:integrase
MAKWKSTKYPGVRFREHKTRKHGIRPDQYFSVRYQKDGKRKEEGVGWASEGWSAQKVALKLAELKAAAVTGEGDARLSEARAKVKAQREKVREEKIQRERELISLDTYFKEIYYPAISQEKKEKAANTEEQLFRLWISPTMGGNPLKEITAFDLERLKKIMSKAGRAPRTIEYALTTLGQIFRHAQRFDYYEGNIPTTQVKKPKYDNKRVRFLSQDEAHTLLKILKGISERTYRQSILALHCGLRAGEVFSLTWKDVDMEHNLITLLDTKSGKTRTLSMTADVKSIFSQMGPGKKQSLVFTTKDGERIKIISNSFRKAVKKAGFNEGVKDRRQRVTFHTLRHTFASWLVMEGISLYEVKELMGHSSLTMTERYSHLAPDRNRRAAATMEKVFQTNATDNVVNLR